MNSEDHNVNVSKYGSLDDKSSTTTENTENNINQPPKPAIRQRIQKSSRSASGASQTTNTDQHQKVDFDSTKNPAEQPEKSSKSSSYDRVLNELSKSPIMTTQKRPEAEEETTEATSKKGLSLPLSTNLVKKPESRPYPKKVLFIVANEFCERFSYYGLRTVLLLYFKNVLEFTDSSSTVSFHLFVTLCYLTPIFGAILGDSILGKFKTILYLSIVYFLGELILVLSSIFWYSFNISTSYLFIGLLLIGIGTGGIKPCVSALGGDQFLPHEDRWRLNFFSLFYGAINLGSLISTFLTPMLRSNYSCVNRKDCYPLAFGVPCALMFVSIVVFVVAKNHYTIVPLPERNVIVAFCQCIWIALKRRISGYKPPVDCRPQMIAPSENTSSSNLSMGSTSTGTNDEALVKKGKLGQFSSEPSRQTIAQSESESILPIVTAQTPLKCKHWLYLASDRFDAKSIEDFRSVLGVLLLYLPLPIYWCLFDQQSSLWTLQATRMDGTIIKNIFVLEPDQMSVANPLLLLVSISVFQIFIYPTLTKCNILTKPISRMTFGGLLAALAFVLSALIDYRIQQFAPMERPPTGQASLLIVNGLSDCSLTNPVISYIQIPNNDTRYFAANTTKSQLLSNRMSALSSKSISLASIDYIALNNYSLRFKLSNSNNTNSISTFTCPLDLSKDYEFSIKPLQDQSTRLLYLEQGNGKLIYKLFNDSLKLPPPGQARIRLLYEAFGSVANAEKRRFSLLNMAKGNDKIHNSTTFNATSRDGQVFLSDYIDVPISGYQDELLLVSNDHSLDTSNIKPFFIEQGTRNLIVVHQKSNTFAEVKHQVIQDNKYRISLLYQLGPYLLISVSEVMFSITGLEFSYANAPEHMKSVILGAWSLTTAFGNILIVAVESIHPFSNLMHGFLFYAAIMALDMIVFAYLGSNFKPYKRLDTT